MRERGRHRTLEALSGLCGAATTRDCNCGCVFNILNPQMKPGSYSPFGHDLPHVHRRWHHQCEQITMRDITHSDHEVHVAWRKFGHTNTPALGTWPVAFVGFGCDWSNSVPSLGLRSATKYLSTKFDAENKWPYPGSGTTRGQSRLRNPKY
jgi:hypothetical protein